MIKRLIWGVFDQNFLILVALFVISIFTLGNIHGQQVKKFGASQPQVSYSKSLQLSGQNKVSRVVPAQTTKTGKLLPIPSWNGLVQPIPKPKHKTKLAPVYFKVPTKEPVVFLGIDDGWTQTPEIQEWLIDHHLPFSLFLTNAAIENNYGYFQALEGAGMVIENHTLVHPDMTSLSYKHQKQQICETADIYQRVFGRRPTLFRPPYGYYDNDTRRAATACGMRALVMWHAMTDKEEVEFQDIRHLEPGDIILMHFKPEFLEDMNAFIKQVRREHMQIGRLEDWIQ